MRTSLKRLASNLRLLLWAVALLSMLFSGLLEMLDHHWVERMPTHSHLALNGMGVIAAHQHAYQETHRHASTSLPAERPTVASLLNFESSNVVPAIEQPTSPLLASALAADAPARTPFSPLHTATTLPPSATISPDLLPPRQVPA